MVVNVSLFVVQDFHLFPFKVIHELHEAQAHGIKCHANSGEKRKIGQLGDCETMAQASWRDNWNIPIRSISRNWSQAVVANWPNEAVHMLLPTKVKGSKRAVLWATVGVAIQELDTEARGDAAGSQVLLSQGDAGLDFPIAEQERVAVR